MLEVGKLWHETGLQKRSGLWHPQVPRSCSPVIWSDVFFFVLPKSVPVAFGSSWTEKNAQYFERLGENQDFRMFRDSDRRQQPRQKSIKNQMNETRNPTKRWCPEWQSSQGWHPWHRGCAGTCWQGVGRHLQAVNQLYLFPRRCQKNFLSQLCQLARDNYLLQQVIRFLKFASNL